MARFRATLLTAGGHGSSRLDDDGLQVTAGGWDARIEVKVRPCPETGKDLAEVWLCERRKNGHRKLLWSGMLHDVGAS